MPAVMDDPDAPTIYRTSGEPPYPDPNGPPSFPSQIIPRKVTLRDRQTAATVLPFASKDQVPASLIRYLADQYNQEIEGGDTYPMTDTMPYDRFASYWFQNFGAIMLLGALEQPEDIFSLPEASSDGPGDWSKTCLGAFYIKPNYPGRSSHICNAGFLVTDASRNRGVGRLMGESYLDWAPKMGYTYSMFNLVYETNVASCKIWDALGFKRIGRVKAAGNLRSHPGHLVDAIMYGRDLVPGEFPEDTVVSEERFDKIKFYLKFGKYPAGADRAEKSRLRSAATHYKIVENDVLMLKDKEVVPDPRRQWEISRETHMVQHGGINKTTATIAERYHWSRIKETVSDVIKNCTECNKDQGKPSAAGGVSAVAAPQPDGASATSGPGGHEFTTSKDSSATDVSEAVALQTASHMDDSASNHAQTSSISALSPSTTHTTNHHNVGAPDMFQAAGTSTAAAVNYNYPSPEDLAGGITPAHTLRDPSASPHPQHQGVNPQHNPMLQDQPTHHHQQAHATHQPPHHQHTSHPNVYQPIDPQMINQPAQHHDPYAQYNTHSHAQAHDQQAETDFQAFLNAASATDGTTHHPPPHHHQSQAHDQHQHQQTQHQPQHHQSQHHQQQALSFGTDMDAVAAAAAAQESEREREAVDRDLDMLIEQGVTDFEDEAMADMGMGASSALAADNRHQIQQQQQQQQYQHQQHQHAYSIQQQHQKQHHDGASAVTAAGSGSGGKNETGPVGMEDGQDRTMS